jgi:hypothetical protein
MRKISSDAYNAFINNKRFKSSNTEVRIEDGETAMYLFGNKIAETQDGETFISGGGYKPSNTTRDRLNAFPEVWLSINKGRWIINQKITWDGKWASINKFEECL